MGPTGLTKTVMLLGAASILAACEDGQGPSFDFLKGKPKAEASANAIADGPAGAVEERDTEAPEIFNANENGLWDGRPSLGGVWVAYPDVKDPERVLIRNETNDKFVIGALFRRERDNPGPKLQVSSDAAEALGLLAGQPTKLSVVALRKEVVTVTLPPEELPADTLEADTEALSEAPEIEASSIDPIASASAALDRAAAQPAAPAPTPVAAPAPAAPKPKASSLAKPFIQIGIFSVKANADNTATSLRSTGVIPVVKKQSSAGKTFYRVLIGPAQSSSERAALLKKAKGLGFNDAYFVTN